MPKTQQPEMPLPTRDAASYLGVSIVRIKQWVADGRLPRREVGSGLVHFRADLDAVERKKGGRKKREKSGISS